MNGGEATGPGQGWAQAALKSRGRLANAGDVGARALGVCFEEARAWLTARPRPVNRLDQTISNRFYETGPDLVASIADAIACGQHVALAGPRGCGKSFCVEQAIRLAAKQGLLPPRGWIKVQGNKELPRDYLFEDDVSLVVTDDKTVIPRRKTAPLFAFAERSDQEETLGRPVTDEEGRVICYGLNQHGVLDREARLMPGQRIVLFLDEVNRFSDGVLDSLLLLLEEGEVIMGGERFRLPVVVLMTMNPPGYDASARTLSPPLSARIGRQYRLLSPQLDVLTDRIAADVVSRIVKPSDAGGLGTKAIAVAAPTPNVVRRAAAVTLAAWGAPPEREADAAPGFDYLSHEMREMLRKLSALTPRVGDAMRTLEKLCHFGPDGRALGDWIVAASVSARNEAAAAGAKLARAEPRHFIATAVTVLSHKLQDNFSSASRPDCTRDKELALQSLVIELMESDDPELDGLLSRAVDTDEGLREIDEALADGYGSDALRAALLRNGLTRDFDVRRWSRLATALEPLRRGFHGRNKVEANLTEALLKAGIIERLGPNLTCRSPGDRAMLEWFAPAAKAHERNVVALKAAFTKILGGLRHHTEAAHDALSRHVFVDQGVWPEDPADLAGQMEAKGLSKLTTPDVVVLFDRLDDVWIQTEHQGAKAVDPLVEHVSAISAVDAEAGEVAATFAADVLGRMARKAERGGRTRAACRRFNAAVAKADATERSSDKSDPPVAGTAE